MVELVPGVTPERLAKVYAHPQMERTGHDFRAPGFVDDPRALYVSAFVDSVFAGAAMLFRASSHEIEVHSLLLPEFARWSRLIWRALIRFALRVPGVERLTAQVPEDLLTVRNLAKKCGFREEGFKRRAIRRHGEWMGLYILGITAQEVDIGIYC